MKIIGLLINAKKMSFQKYFVAANWYMVYSQWSILRLPVYIHKTISKAKNNSALTLTNEL